MEKKKSNTGIIVILIIIILGLVGYIIYDKVIIRETGSKEQDTIVNASETDNDNIIEENYESIAKQKVPVFLSFVNQSAGYAYCGNYIGSSYQDSILETDNFRGFTSGSYKSLEELKADLKNYVTEEVFNKYFNNDEKAYIEKDNKLYCSDYAVDGYGSHFKTPSAIKFDDMSYTVSDLKSDSFKATISFKYESLVDFCKFFIYEVSFVKENDNWLASGYTERSYDLNVNLQ